jgi:hypothetical protein
MIEVKSENVRCLHCLQVLDWFGDPDREKFRSGRGLRVICRPCGAHFELNVMDGTGRGQFLRSLVQIEICGECKEKLEVLPHRSDAGWYLGRWCNCGPVDRESGYYPSQASALEELGRRASRPGWNPGRFSVERETKARSAPGHSPKGNSGAERARGGASSPGARVGGAR